MDTTSGLKVGKRDISGPTVCDGLPSSRWPVIESEEDVCLTTFDVFLFLGVFFVVNVIGLVQIYFAPLWKLGRVISPAKQYGVVEQVSQ